MKTQVHDSFTSHREGTPFGWQDRLDQASSRDEIAAIARDFVARLSAEEYSKLPPHCRPRKIVDADDVVDYAVTLMKGSCEDASMSDAVLQHLGSFFTDACLRLSQLDRAAPDEPLTTQ